MPTDDTEQSWMKESLRALRAGDYRAAVTRLQTSIDLSTGIAAPSSLVEAFIAELLDSSKSASRQRQLLAALLDAPAFMELIISDAINQGLLEPALKWCDQLIARYPENQLAHLKRSFIRMVLGDRKGDQGAWDEADALYRRSLADINALIRTMPGEAWFYLQRARLWIRLSEGDAALSDYARALEANPSAIEIRLERGWLYHGLTMYEEAIGDFEAFLASRPDDLLAYHGLGLAWLAMENAEQALQSFSKAINLDPRFVGAYIGRAEAHLLQDDFDTALADYSCALALDPSRAEVYLQRGKLHAINAEYHSSIGDVNIADQEFQNALSDYAMAIERDPDRSDAYLARADVWWQLDDTEQALADSDRAVTLDPELFEGFIRRGHILRAVGRHKEALADYTAAIRLEPDDPSGYFHRGEVFQQLEDYKAALEDYNQTLELDPEFSFAYYQCAVIYEQQGDYEKALMLYNSAVKTNPYDSSTRRERAACQLYIAEQRERSGHTEKANALYRAAIEDYTAVLNIRVDDTAALYGRGYAAYRLSEHALALADYTRLLELEPDHVDAYVRRGETLADMGDVERALEDLAHALSLDPESTEALAYRADLHLYLGNAAIENGQRDAAHQAYRQAIADYTGVMGLVPEIPDLYTNRGRAAAYLGDFATAEADYSHALAIDPAHEETLRERALLYMLMDQLDEALNDCARLVEIAPDDASGFILRGGLLVQLKRYGEAVSAFERALELDRSQHAALTSALQAQLADALRLHSEAIGAPWDTERALRLCEEALADKATAAEAVALWNAKGRALLTLDRFLEAEVAFRAVLDLQPGNAWAQLGLIKAALFRGEPALALAACDSLLEQPENVPVLWAHVGMGLAFERLDRGGETERAFAEALGSDPAVTATQRFANRASILEEFRAYERAEADRLQNLALVRQAYIDLSSVNAPPDVLLDTSRDLAASCNALAELYASRMPDQTRLERALTLMQEALTLEDEGINRCHYLDTLAWTYWRLRRPEEARPLLEEAVLLAPSDEVIRHHLDVVRGALTATS